MKQSKAQAYVRQLCCLGLSREIMISELLRALHSLIPSEDNFFAGLDQNYSPAYVLAEQFTFEALDVYLNQPAQLFLRLNITSERCNGSPPTGFCLISEFWTIVFTSVTSTTWCCGSTTITTPCKERFIKMGASWA